MRIQVWERSGFSNNVAMNSLLVLVILFGLIQFVEGYFVGSPIQNRKGSSSNVPRHEEQGTLPPSRYASSLFSAAPSSMDGPNSEIAQLCDAGEYEEAFKSLVQLPPDNNLKSSYIQILKSLVDRQSQLHEVRALAPKETNNQVDYKTHLNQADKVVQKLLEIGGNSDNALLLPEAEVINDLIGMWGCSTFAEEASVRCESYLDLLWSLYDEQKEQRFVPLFESYYNAISACSARDRGLDAAKRAERLMKDMQSKSKDHAELRPNRSIANGVMTAWSKSGQQFKKGKKCEQMLERMIKIAQSEESSESESMAPDTNSFNIVLNALAQGKEKNSEFRAEELLERMESLSAKNVDQDGRNVTLNCAPDEISFNVVLNCWATSGHQGAAERATAILDHMKKRHEAGVTNVQPDWSSYATVLKACARSKDRDAIDRAEAVFSEYQEACESDESNFSHNAFAYNSMINCYAKSRHPDAGKRAIDLFEKMRVNMGKPGWEMCFLDIYTYTSLVDAIAKQQSYEASEQAITLLEEVEESFAKTGDVRLEPNIRLYTSVVNAIGRSHESPDRAKAIVDRIESSYLEGRTNNNLRPDVVFYNALINAYGWSNAEGRAQKSFEILKHMISLSESGKLPDVKPDTVSFNSVLNACAHEYTKDKSTSDNIMKIVVEAFEMLKNSPEYGKPDQRTYVQVLDSIYNHLDENDAKRAKMAEVTFLQCASNGLVGPSVIPKLFATVQRSRFEALMGPASKGRGNQLKFDVSELPAKWTANAMTPYSRNGRRSRSRKVQNNYQVTKNVISKQQNGNNNREKNLTR